MTDVDDKIGREIDALLAGDEEGQGEPSGDLFQLDGLEALERYLEPSDFEGRDMLTLSYEEMLALDYEGQTKLMAAIGYRQAEMRLPRRKLKGMISEMDTEWAMLKDFKSTLRTAMRAAYYG